MPTVPAGSGSDRKPWHPTWSARAPGFMPRLPSWKGRVLSSMTGSLSRAGSGPAAIAFRTDCLERPAKQPAGCQKDLTPLSSPLTRVTTTNPKTLSGMRRERVWMNPDRGQDAARRHPPPHWSPATGSRVRPMPPGPDHGIPAWMSWPSPKPSSCRAAPRAIAIATRPPPGGGG